MSEEKRNAHAMPSAEELRGGRGGGAKKGSGHLRTLLLVLAVLFLAAALFLLSGRLGPGETEAPVQQETRQEMVPLSSRQRSEVTSVTVSPADSPAYTILNLGDRCAMEGAEAFGLDQNRAGALIGYAAVLTANRMVTDKAENLADFGLDSPLSTVTCRYSDGSEAVWLVGSRAPTSTASYVMGAGGSAVYLLYPSAVESFSRTRAEMHTLTLPVQVDSSRIRRVLVEAPGRDNVEFGYSGEDSGDRGYSISALRLRQPFYYTANVERCMEILNGCAGLTVSSYAGETGELSGTGLEDGSFRLRLTLSLSAEDPSLPEQEYVYTVGSFTDDGQVYVRADGTDAVYLAPADTVAFLDRATPEYLVDQFTNLIYIQAVDSIDLTGGGKAWNLSIIRGTDVNGNSTEAFDFNGRRVRDEKGFRSLYQQIIGMTSSKISPDFHLEGEELLSVHYTLNVEPYALDIAYLEYDEDYCALRRDGVTLFLCKRDQLTRLLEALDAFPG